MQISYRAGNTIPVLFITRFTSSAGSNGPNSKDFLHFLGFRTTGFF